MQRDLALRCLLHGGVLLLVLLALLACGAPPPAAPPTSFAHIIDLSHTITQDMPHLPGQAPTRLQQPDATGSPTALQLGSTGGTSLRLPPTQRLDQHSPRDLVLPVVVLDVRAASLDNPDYRLQPADIAAWEATHGQLPAGSMVLLATGWDLRWGDPDAYLNLDAQGQPHVPGLSAAAVALLHERRIAGVGSDTPRLPGLAAPPAPWLLLTNLGSIEQLPPTGAVLVIGALKLQGAQAAPARVLALVP
jgi:kynurenine formamidase